MVVLPARVARRFFRMAFSVLVSTAETLSSRISTIESLDKILFLDDGKLLDAGTHQELLDRCPDYRKMVELQKLEEEGGEAHA